MGVVTLLMAGGARESKGFVNGSLKSLRRNDEILRILQPIEDSDIGMASQTVLACLLASDARDRRIEGEGQKRQNSQRLMTGGRYQRVNPLP